MGSTPEPSDDARVGLSLANLAEIVIACLDAIAARSIVEVGAYRGELTRMLLDWAGTAGARVTAVEPSPPAELVELGEQHPELEIVGEISHEALHHLPPADALILDGDHNYYTVSEELRLIYEKASGADSPLLLLHDVGWPHARRDMYWEPERIPDEYRQPMAKDTGVVFGEPGLVADGLPYPWAAVREGGPRNGVLTAIEDFTAEQDGLRVAIVPAFFGLGVVWHQEAPWANAVTEIVEPWDRNPVLERLEASRVTYLGTAYALREALEREWERAAEQEQLLTEREDMLRAMLDSRAFAWGERLSRLRQRGRPSFSRAQVRRMLGK